MDSLLFKLETLRDHLTTGAPAGTSERRRFVNHALGRDNYSSLKDVGLLSVRETRATMAKVLTHVRDIGQAMEERRIRSVTATIVHDYEGSAPAMLFAGVNARNHLVVAVTIGARPRAH